LPPRAPDMLTVRFGQLTVRGLPPLEIRSLVGCSPNEERSAAPGTRAWKARAFHGVGCSAWLGRN
ncbi:MAG: hypothetical protein L0312_30480, partial [Acidobacteria bacterium]|nr:hypothetical protein [Acidobacteriota bacterium]